MHLRLREMRRMPDEVRRLRAPWPSLAAEVPHLTPALEREFRFGQRVSLTERGFLLGGTIKGGSSSMWFPADADLYEAYLRWRSIEGFRDEADRGAYDDLVALLAEHRIELLNGRAAQRTAEERGGFRRDLGEIYPMILGILRALPAEHLAGAELRRIRLGGWGPDAAKASAYADGTLYLYDFATRGARRTAIGLFLHELGHAFEHRLPAAAREELRELYRRIAAADALFGIEYLLDAESRRLYQKMAFEEFIAETHLAYTACGAGLRTFVEARTGETQTAWRIAYALYREGFGGVEYE